MDNACYRQFIAEMEPLLRTLIECEEKASAPHTPSGQLREHILEGEEPPWWYRKDVEETILNTATKFTEAIRKLKPCPECNVLLSGKYSGRHKAWIAYCKSCNRIKYIYHPEESGWEPVDLPNQPI